MQYDVAFTFKYVNKIIKCDQSYSLLSRWFQRLRLRIIPNKRFSEAHEVDLKNRDYPRTKLNGSLERGSDS